MERARPLLDPRLGGLQRVVVVNGLAREVALHEPDGLAVADVHRG
jgi:hypothetical protein